MIAGEVKELLKDPTPEKARALLDKIPDLVPEDPTLAPLLAEEMAKAYGDAFTKARAPSAPDDAALANSTDANGNEHAEKGSGNGGQFVSKGEGSSGTPSETTEKSDGASHEQEIKPATRESVAKFLQDPPDRISPDEADALLAAGFEDKDGAGNSVKYGQLLRDHIDRESHSEKDRIARKQRLGVAVKVIRAATPQPSGDAAKPNERVYTGMWNGKAYVGIADEHGEMNAMLMVSYRRDSRHDEK